MFESRISAGATEKIPGWEKPHAKTVASCSKMRLNDTVNWQTRKWSNCTKFQALVWMIINSNRRNSQSVGELSQVCSQIFLKMLVLGTNWRPDILWSGNKLTRSVTKWTQACDRRLARLISYFHHTNEFRQHCHVGNTAQHCRLGFTSRLRLCWRS